MKNLSKAIFVFILLFPACNSYGQNRASDSLEALLKTTKDDKTKLDLYFKLARNVPFLTGKPKLGEEYAVIWMKLARKIGDSSLLCEAYYNAGNTYYFVGQHGVSMNNLLEAIKIGKTNQKKNNKNICKAERLIAILYMYQNDFKTAFQWCNSANQIANEIHDTVLIEACLRNTGVIYLQAKNYEKAILYLEKARAYFIHGYGEENLSLAYLGVNNTEKAFFHANNAIKIFELVNDKNGISEAEKVIGKTFFKLGKYNEAINHYDFAYSLCKKVDAVMDMSMIDFLLYESYEKLGQYKKALDHHKSYLFFKDKAMTQNKIEEVRSKFDEKEKEFLFKEEKIILQKEKENQQALADANSKRSKIIIWSVCSILLLVIVFSIFLYRSYLEKQRQKELIEQKQKAVLDSIYYARRIQRSLLTSEKYIEKSLKKLLTK